MTHEGVQSLQQGDMLSINVCGERFRASVELVTDNHIRVAWRQNRRYVADVIQKKSPLWQWIEKT